MLCQHFKMQLIIALAICKLFWLRLSRRQRSLVRSCLRVCFFRELRPSLRLLHTSLRLVVHFCSTLDSLCSSSDRPCCSGLLGWSPPLKTDLLCRKGGCESTFFHKDTSLYCLASCSFEMFDSNGGWGFRSPLPVVGHCKFSWVLCRHNVCNVTLFPELL